MSLLSRKKPVILGLDISSTSVKLLELEQDGDNYRVQSLAVEPLPDNAVVEKSFQDVEAIGETIQKAVKRSGTKTKLAAVAVAGSAVITKIINMPANLSENELELQIQQEADQYIPYPLEEINLDFEVVGPTENNPDSVDVLLAASRSENIENRTDALDIGGLTAKVVDVEAYTVIGQAPPLAGPQAYTHIVEHLLLVIDHRRPEPFVAHDVRAAVEQFRVGRRHDDPHVVEAVQVRLAVINLHNYEFHQVRFWCRPRTTQPP